MIFFNVMNNKSHQSECEMVVTTSTKAWAGAGGEASCPIHSRDFSPGPGFHLNSELNGGTFGPLEILENMN